MPVDVGLHQAVGQPGVVGIELGQGLLDDGDEQLHAGAHACGLGPLVALDGGQGGLHGPASGVPDDEDGARTQQLHRVGDGPVGHKLSIDALPGLVAQRLGGEGPARLVDRPHLLEQHPGVSARHDHHVGVLAIDDVVEVVLGEALDVALVALEELVEHQRSTSWIAAS